MGNSSPPRFNSSPPRLMALIFLVFVFIFVSYAHLYQFKQGGLPPVYLYASFLGWVILAALVNNLRRFAHGLPRNGALFAVLFWLLIYSIYLVWHAIVSPHPGIALQSLISGLEMVLIFAASTYILIIYRLVTSVMWVMIVTALLSVFFNVLDFLNPSFTNVPGRAAGLYENPTISGRMLVLLMLASVWVLPRRLHLVFLVVCGMGVLLTFSRGAWALWMVGFFAYWLNSSERPIKKYFFRSSIASSVALALALLVFSGSLGSLLTGSRMEEYLTPNTMARLGIGAEVVSGDSAGERENLIYLSVLEWAESPLLGKGVGYTEAWADSHRPHNMYLLFLVEGGVLGLLIYLMMLGGLWWVAAGPGKSLVVIVALSGFFTHNNLEQVAMMIIYAFIVAHGVSARNDKRTTEVLSSTK